jgi:FlaA1/EpsC-like NDP-sugar epimerase
MVIKKKPSMFLNISTDKAAEATTLYGSTKKVGEKIINWAGYHIEGTKFGSTRFGNVIQTRGNVFEVWENEMKQNKPLSITHPNMKRYFYDIEDASRFILDCIPIMKQGEIFIPKMKLYKILDLAEKVSTKHKIIGLRRGEKLEEILMTEEERKRAVETKDMWIIK